MFLVFALLCMDDANFYCFGTQASCDRTYELYDVANRIEGDFQTLDINEFNGSAWETKASTMIFIAAESEISLNHKISSITSELVFFGGEKRATLTIEIDENSHTEGFLYFHALNLRIKSSSKTRINITNLVMLNCTVQELDMDIEVQELHFCLGSKILSSDKNITTGNIYVEAGYELPKFNYTESYKVNYYIPYGYDFVEVDTNIINFFKEKGGPEKLTLSTYDGIELNGFRMQVIFVDGEIIPDFFVKDPTKPVSQYNKIKINENVDKYRFTGAFPIPDQKDYIFSLYYGEPIFNTTYIPFYRTGYLPLMLQTSNFSFLFQSESISVVQHEDFKNLTTHVYCNDDMAVELKSANFIVHYNNYSDYHGFSACINEFSASKIISNNFLNPNNRISIGIKPSFSPLISDDTLKYYDNEITLVEFGSIDLGDIYISFHFEYMGSFKDLDKIFIIYSKVESGITKIVIKKNASVPFYTPNFRICNGKCIGTSYSNDYSFWIYPSNFSEIFNYFSTNTSNDVNIVFEIGLESIPFNFSKFPIFKNDFEISFNNKEFYKTPVNIFGNLSISSLYFQGTFLAVSETNLNANIIRIGTESDIFSDNLHFDAKTIFEFDMGYTEVIPEYIKNYTFLLGYFSLYVTAKECLAIDGFNGNIYKSIDVSNLTSIIDFKDRIGIYKYTSEPIFNYSFKTKLYNQNFKGDTCRLNIQNDWKNSFVDFIDFEYADGRTIAIDKNQWNIIPPFLDLSGFAINQYFGGYIHICLVSSSEHQPIHCKNGNSKIYNYNEGLDFLASNQYTGINIYLAPTEEIIEFTCEHLVNAGNYIISDDPNNKVKVRLPAFPPIAHYFFKDIILVTDHSTPYVIPGIIENVEFENMRVNKCYYFLEEYDVSLVQKMKPLKFAKRFSNFVGNFDDIDRNLTISRNHSDHRLISITDTRNVTVNFFEDHFDIFTKNDKHSRVKYDYKANDTIMLDIQNYVNISISFDNIEDEAFNFDLIVLGNPENIIVNSSKRTKISITANHFISNGKLTFFGSGTWNTIDTNVTKIVLNDSLKCTSLILKKNVTIESNSTEIVNITSEEIILYGDAWLSPNFNIVSTIVDFNTPYYPIVHQFDEDRVSTIKFTEFSYQSSFHAFEENTIIKLMPVFRNEYLSNDVIKNLKQLCSIIKNEESSYFENYGNLYNFVDSNYKGFTNELSVVTISHNASEISFQVTGDLTPLYPIGLCYGNELECPKGTAIINELTVSAIQSEMQDKTELNLFIQFEECNVSLEFDRKMTLNFIHVGKMQCMLYIFNISNFDFISFNNFDINSSVNFINKTPSKFEQCMFESSTSQTWGEVVMDLYSASNIVCDEFDRKILDPEVKITKYILTNDEAYINDFHFAGRNNIYGLLIDQSSIETKGLVFNIFFNFWPQTFILHTDLTIRMTGYRFHGITDYFRTEGPGLLTVISAVNNEQVPSNVTWQIVPQTIKRICIGSNHEKCPSGSDIVQAYYLQDLIYEDRATDVTEVYLVDNEVLRISNTQKLMGKNLIIESLLKEKGKVLIETDELMKMVLLNFSNIDLTIKRKTSGDHFYFSSLTLSNSYVTLNDKSGSIVNDFLSANFINFDMKALINGSSLGSTTASFQISPTTSDLNDFPNIHMIFQRELVQNVNYNEYIEHDTFYLGDNDLKLVQNSTTNAYDVYNSKGTKIFQMSKLKKMLTINLTFSQIEEKNITFISNNNDYIFNIRFTSTLVLGGYIMLAELPPTIYLLNDSYVDLANDIELVKDIDIKTTLDKTKRPKLTINKGFKICINGRYMIKMKSGNLDLYIDCIHIYDTSYDKLPVELMIDEKGMSKCYITNVTSTENCYKYLNMNTYFTYGPSELPEIPKDVFNIRATSQCTNISLDFTSKIKIHGLYNKACVLGITSVIIDNRLVINVEQNSEISSLNMIVCISKDPCDDIAFEDMMIPEVTTSLTINVLTENSECDIILLDPKLSINVVASPNSISEMPIRINSVNLTLNRLSFDNLDITSTSNWFINVSEYLTFNRCMISPSAKFIIEQPCSMRLDARIFRVMMPTNALTLIIDRCDIRKVSFYMNTVIIEDGYEIPGKIPVTLEYNHELIDRVELEALNSRELAIKDFKLKGNVEKIKFTGTLWPLVEITHNITFDHSDLDIVISSETNVAPINLIGTGNVTYIFNEEKSTPYPTKTPKQTLTPMPTISTIQTFIESSHIHQSPSAISHQTKPTSLYTISHNSKPTTLSTIPHQTKHTSEKPYSTYIPTPSYQFTPTEYFIPTPNATMSPSPKPTMTPIPEATPKVIIINGEKKDDGIHVEEIKPETGKIKLMGGSEEDKENMIINNVVIESGTTATAVNLILNEELTIHGQSSLKSDDEGKIELAEDDKVIMSFVADRSNIPSIDFGNIGSNYQKAPKELDIKLDATLLNQQTIENEFKEGKLLVTAKTLNCELWLERANLSNIVGFELYNFRLECLNSRLNDLPSRSLVLKAALIPATDREITPTKKNNIAVIVGAVVGVAIVIIIIIVVTIVVLRRRNRYNKSSSSSLSLSMDDNKVKAPQNIRQINNNNNNNINAQPKDNKVAIKPVVRQSDNSKAMQLTNRNEYLKNKNKEKIVEEPIIRNKNLFDTNLGPNKVFERTGGFIMNDYIIDFSIYRKIRKINQGASGCVYLVEDGSHKRFAVKEISLENSPRLGESFMREVNIMCEAQHPCVVKIYGFSFADSTGTARISLEYLERGSLDSLIFTHKLSPTQKSIIVVGICFGMRYIHSIDIIHRDLKPANILLNENLEAKIGDFGISRFYEGEGLDMTVNIGTPLYAAPEVINHDPYNISSDVYSFGLILLELVNEKPVYDKTIKLFALMRMKYDNNFGEISSEATQLARSIIENCLKPDAEFRPTFDQILAVIKKKNFGIFKGENNDDVAKYYSKIESCE